MINYFMTIEDLRVAVQPKRPRRRRKDVIIKSTPGEYEKFRYLMNLKREVGLLRRINGWNTWENRENGNT